MSVKKGIVVVLTAFAICAGFVSCASKPKTLDGSMLEGEIIVTDEKTSDEKAPKNKKEEDSVSGWKTAKGHSVDATYGLVRLRAKTKKGTFNIAYIDEKNYKTVPVLTTSDEYNTTAFYLKAGEKIINLNTDTRVKYTGWKTDSGMVLGYRIDNVADVMVEFECFQSDPHYDIDSVKVSVTVTNTGKKRTKFAVKAVLDTVLGEIDRHHFYNCQNYPVKSEISLRSFDENPWFISRNSIAAMQILLKGGDAVEPELLALANYSTLNTRSWEPDLLSYRTFDTVLSYNNSACGIVWPGKPLSMKEQFTDVFYISLSEGDRKPSGADYFDVKPVEGKKSTVKAEKEAAVKEKVEADSDKNSKKEVESVKQEKNEADPLVPYVTFDVKTLTREQLSSEYIQKLLNRIAVLEESDDSLNKEELIQLNAELDAILEALRM